MSEGIDNFEVLIKGDPSLTALEDKASVILSTTVVANRVIIDYSEFSVDQVSAEQFRDELLAVPVTEFDCQADNAFPLSDAQIQVESWSLYRRLAQNQTGVTEGSYLYLSGNGAVVGSSAEGEEYVPLILRDGASILGKVAGCATGIYYVQSGEIVSDGNDLPAAPVDVIWGGILILTEAKVLSGDMGVVECPYETVQVPIAPRTIGWGHLSGYDPTAE